MWLNGHREEIRRNSGILFRQEDYYPLVYYLVREGLVDQIGIRSKRTSLVFYITPIVCRSRRDLWPTWTSGGPPDPMAVYRGLRVLLRVRGSSATGGCVFRFAQRIPINGDELPARLGTEGQRSK